MFSVCVEESGTIMKTGRSPDRKTVKASRKCCLKTGSIGAKNSTKRTNKSSHKVLGCRGEFLDKNEDWCSPFEKAVGVHTEICKEDTLLTEKRATLELYPGQTPVSSEKMKLQLFPINKGTRMGLEKDGYNPYLELTFKGQKKISSVLKHLEGKWGSSRIAIGEPMLFPYNIMENLSNCQRWTLNDDILATAVYAAVGSPKIFRLRYGWFCIQEPGSLCTPFTFIPFEAGIQSGGTQGDHNTNNETLCNERDKVMVTSKECKASKLGDATNAAEAQKIGNASVDPLDNEPRTNSSLRQPSLLWVDSLTNISSGGLLSEASLQGKFTILDPKSHGSNTGMHPNQIISDSLDAFLTTQISHAEDLRTSILDAEETCHAFPLRKFSSSAKDVQTPSEKSYSEPHSQVVSSNSVRLSNADKVNNQDELQQDSASWKTDTDLLLSSRTYDDETSLGLTGIKWNDSLGPFDLGMPTQKLFGGDSVSIGGFVR